MYQKTHKRSAFVGATWLGLAVFFMVFCSCPVKRYIRMQLFKQHAPIENTSGASISTNIAKDCTVAERQDQGAITTLIASFPGPTPQRDVVTAFIPALLAFAGLYFFRKKDDLFVIHHLHQGIPVPIPLYLRLRHLQV